MSTLVKYQIDKELYKKYTKKDLPEMIQFLATKIPQDQVMHYFLEKGHLFFNMYEYYKNEKIN